MLWLEMSRDRHHGGPGWEFTKCLWSPTHNRKGTRQGWWELHRLIAEGDQVLHLKGAGQKAAFVAISTCMSKVQIRTDKPPLAGKWEYAESYYRVDLANTEHFQTQIPLHQVLRNRREALTAYFHENSEAASRYSRTIFYVVQGGRLQCQNGAYLSEVDEELSKILLSASDNQIVSDWDERTLSAVGVGIRIAQSAQRTGQQIFSETVKRNFGRKCCFPGCDVSDSRFLVGSHIARWADVADLRGQINNGLCLCLIHDKAFELGLFSLDENLRIIESPLLRDDRWFQSKYLSALGKKIKPSKIRPSEEAILHHWVRVGI
jgi:putative restriction endonuclease